VRVVVGLVGGTGALALCLIAGFRALAAAEVTLVTKEISLGRFHPSSLIPECFIVSPDSKRVAVAYVANRGDKWLAVVDGVRGKEFDEIGATGLVFSPDSKRVAYEAIRAENGLVVVDGVEGKEYDGIGAGNPVFSPDSQRLAYAARRGDKSWVVVDGVELKAGDGIGEDTLVFSPDSKHVGYWAGRRGKWGIVVDGAEGKEYDEFLNGSRLVFDSPSQFHALALRDDESLLVEVQIVTPAAEPSEAPQPHRQLVQGWFGVRAVRRQVAVESRLQLLGDFAGGADIGFDVCVPSLALRPFALKYSPQPRRAGVRS
jgi:hypothetical protein